MKSNTYEELKRLAVNLGYAQTKEEVPGEDIADVFVFSSMTILRRKNEDENSGNPEDALE